LPWLRAAMDSAQGGLLGLNFFGKVLPGRKGKRPAGQMGGCGAPNGKPANGGPFARPPGRRGKPKQQVFQGCAVGRFFIGGRWNLQCPISKTGVSLAFNSGGWGQGPNLKPSVARPSPLRRVRLPREAT